MKTLKLLITFCFVAFLSVFGFSQGIAGSAHDFSSASWQSDGEVCNKCHTPHNAKSEPNAPLWDHELTTATFTMYSSLTFDGAGSVGTSPSGSSKLCLSCHDGTVALDSYADATGTNFISGVGDLGAVLSDDHPVSFTYDASLAGTDGELFDPSTATGVGGTIANTMLYGGKMECASCHDVHNSTTADYLLVKSNAGSALCLTCHNK